MGAIRRYSSTQFVEIKEFRLFFHTLFSGVLNGTF